MPTPLHPNSAPSTLTPQQDAELRLEAERMQEVKFLLGNLLEREQITVKAILTCLLDVGAIHFINGRIRIRPLRSLARPLINVSKPALVFVAYRWVQKKCPQLAANWLQRRIVLKAGRPPQPQSLQPSPPVVLEPMLVYQHEIRRLRSRVRLTTGALVGVSSVLILGLIGIDLRSVDRFWQSTVTGQPEALVKTQKTAP
ncbi:hypothetical protein [Altericista sp. CCNU0014]|uniref:hypothetical protein n=1 Tax=Altericista sp. CCNU0014 TaxID=3082949 RepID=UPI00384E847E